ncbi:hypothetical protein [Nocardioides nitrophenolicus]|uniref:hypothetical protein n=1 Tax=Nocardioides nitrophenolicus TaxID=60489 RepID=UPI001956B3F3|nr:hypothetical protein [Nocardioides nitrophenolicus]MBM7518329.1 hypothetical protein [Nocardioides nitrophenolicus]
MSTPTLVPRLLIGAAIGALIGAVIGAAGGCAVSDGAGAAPPSPGRHPGKGLAKLDLGLGFDQVVVPGDMVPGATNDGTATVDITVATQAGGRLTWTPGRAGGSAVRTPGYVAEGPVPAAALVVRTDPSAPDPLDPGAADFVVGVDFRADPATAGRAEDDGDNLVQRGRFGQPAQLKLQLDHGVASCRLAGTLGEVLVQADQAVTPERWYRLTCTRSAGAVRMRLADLDGGTDPREWAVTADPGTITFDGVPLSIGAKLADHGRIAPGSADQFHGTIDRVVLDVR